MLKRIELIGISTLVTKGWKIFVVYVLKLGSPSNLSADICTIENVLLHTREENKNVLFVDQHIWTMWKYIVRNVFPLTMKLLCLITCLHLSLRSQYVKVASKVIWVRVLWWRKLNSEAGELMIVKSFNTIKSF